MVCCSAGILGMGGGGALSTCCSPPLHSSRKSVLQSSQACKEVRLFPHRGTRATSLFPSRKRMEDALRWWLPEVPLHFLLSIHVCHLPVYTIARGSKIEGRNLGNRIWTRKNPLGGLNPSLEGDLYHSPSIKPPGNRDKEWVAIRQSWSFLSWWLGGFQPWKLEAQWGTGISVYDATSTFPSGAVGRRFLRWRQGAKLEKDFPQLLLTANSRLQDGASVYYIWSILR